jgi:hypothetical protein
MNQLYLDTARFIVQVAPFVFADGLFALKDGTAINLFLRDLPRLFIDLDLVFPNYKLPRVEASAQINEGTRIRDVHQQIGRGRRISHQCGSTESKSNLRKFKQQAAALERLPA